LIRGANGAAMLPAFRIQELLDTGCSKRTEERVEFSTDIFFRKRHASIELFARF
jgi:hypothetical protein